MKKVKSLIILAVVMCFSVNMEAQILDRLGKKLEKKASDRLERKIDRTMDKGLDKTEEEIDKSVSKKPKNESEDTDSSVEPAAPSPDGGMFGGMFKSVDIKDEYEFDLSLSYLITSVSEKETSEIEYDFAVADEGEGDLMMTIIDMRVNGKSEMKDEQGEMKMIFDLDNKAMITIMEQQKMYMTMSMDLGEIVEEENEKQELTITKTGKTKTIFGYTCEEYEVTTKDSNGSVWVSSDGKLKNFNPYMAIAGAAKNKKDSNSTNPMSGIEGAMLEMNMTFKDAKKKSDPQTMSYTVTDIKEVNITQDFNGLSNPMQMQK